MVAVILGLMGCTAPSEGDQSTHSDASTEDSSGEDESGTDENGDGDGDGDEACGRLEQRLDGVCSEVQVVDVLTEQVEIRRDGWSLPGRLLIPVGAGEYVPPVVVLIHGSGPQSQDVVLEGELCHSYSAPVPVFASLATQLAQRGIAVLRYDKRSCFAENNPNCSNSALNYPGDPNGILVTDFALDAQAAVDLLSERDDVRSDDVVVAGHSQGALFVPSLVTSNESVSGGVLLAGAAMSVRETIVGQLNGCAQYLEDGGDAAQATQLFELASQYDADLSAIEAGTYASPTFLGAAVSFWTNWIEWADENQESFQSSSDKPMLALSGTRDFNVWPEHLEIFETWAVDASMDNVSTQLLSDYTHGLVVLPEGETDNPTEVGEGAIEAIVSWMTAD